MCLANICTSPAKLMYTARKVSVCPDWKITCPVRHLTTKVYVPWNKMYLPRACGNALMLSPAHMVRVARDFDSLWITGPMTAQQSVAYVRHNTLAPAANLCTISAIVFLPIKAWIWRNLRRYIDGSAILFIVKGPVCLRWLKISPCVMTKIMWNETAFR